MSILRLLQTKACQVGETMNITNIDERTKQRIIRALDEEFDFTVSDKKDYTLTIMNVSTEDSIRITEIINKLVRGYLCYQMPS